MSRPLPRRNLKSAAVVPRREQQSSSRAPSTTADFLTQLKRDELDDSEGIPDSVVPDTPNRSSGRRDIMKSQNVQSISSTSVSPSQHSVQQSKQTENHQKRQSAIPQADIHQSFQSKIKAKQVAEDYLQALDDTPPPELLTAQCDLLELWTKNKGIPPKVVFNGVVQAITSYFPHLSQWIQSGTTGLNQAGATEQHPDPENHGSNPTPNNMRGSQHGSESSQVAPGNVLLRQESNLSRLTIDGGEDLAEQVAALPAKKKGKYLPVRDLTNVTINNEQEFHEALGKYGLRDITLGSDDEPVIKLLDLARETVENVKPKFQQRQREDREVWQVLFSIIANMFVFGPEPLYHTLKGLSKESSAGSNGRPRRNRRGSNDAGDGPISQDGLFRRVPKEKLEEIAESVRCWWQPKKDKNQTQLEKVYVNYKRLETVRLYDAMMSSFRENEENIQNYVGELRDAAHDILSYIYQWIKASHDEFEIKDFPKNSKETKEIKDLSDSIHKFRPICSLVDAFGKGVLLLLINNAEKNVPGKIDEGQTNYPQHKRMRDVALSLCEVDRIKYDGRLRQLFTDLDEKALRPVVQYCEGGDTGGWLYNHPSRDHFERLNVGQRIAQLLICIIGRVSIESGSDLRARTRRPKRRMSHNSMDEDVDGEQGASKRRRTESVEDEESSTQGKDGPGSNTDAEEDIYNS